MLRNIPLLIVFGVILGLVVVILEKLTQASFKTLFGYFFIFAGLVSLSIYFLWFTKILKTVPSFLFAHFEPLREKQGAKGIIFHFVRYALIPIVFGVIILSGGR